MVSILYFHILICGYRTLSTVYYFLSHINLWTPYFEYCILFPSSAGETCDVVPVHYFILLVPYFEYRIWCHIFSTETIIRFQFELLLVENSPTPPWRPTRLGVKTNVCRWNGRVFESPFRQTVLSDNLWIQKTFHMFKKMVNDEMVTLIICGFKRPFTCSKKWWTMKWSHVWNSLTNNFEWKMNRRNHIFLCWIFFCFHILFYLCIPYFEYCILFPLSAGETCDIVPVHNFEIMSYWNRIRIPYF